MPKAEIDTAYLERLLAIPLEVALALAPMRGIEAEREGESITIEATAERPDLLCAEGFAREFGPKSYHLPFSQRSIIAKSDVRPFIRAITAHNIRLDEQKLTSLLQFQEKVSATYGRGRRKAAIGIYDLSQVNSDLHYDARDPSSIQIIPLGESAPLHYHEILEKTAAGKRYAHLVDAASNVPVLSDSGGRIIAVPPITNTMPAGKVSAETRDLLIDVTGTTERTVADLCSIIACNMIDMGAYVEQLQGSGRLANRIVHIDPSYLAGVVGLELSDLDGMLSQRGISIEKGPSGFTACVPLYRTDLNTQTDIAGEIVGIIGLDSLLPAGQLDCAGKGMPLPLKERAAQFSDLSERLSFVEVKNHILSNPEYLERYADDILCTTNAKSSTFSACRQSLQPGLLQILATNQDMPRPVRLYETGNVVRPDLYETIAWAFTVLDSKASFAQAKAVMEAALRDAGVQHTLIEHEERHYIPGRAAAVIIDGEPAGHFGELHPQYLNDLSIGDPVCLGELDLRRT